MQATGPFLESLPRAVARLALLTAVVLVGACGGSEGTGPGDPGGGTLTGPGLTWTAVTAPTGTSTWRGVAYGNAVWVAVGNGYRATSATGTGWASLATPSSYHFQSAVAFANGVFIAPSALGVSSSSDGVAWTNQLLDSAQHLTAVAYGSGTWVMVDDRFLYTDILSFYVSTTNGGGWAQQLTTIPYAQPTAIAFGNGTFVTVGYGGLVATATNPATWTQRDLGSVTDLGLMAVTYADGRFVAVTNSGKAYRSTDGITWTKATVTVNALYGITYGNGVFVAVGAAGSIFTSPDAVTWTRRTWSGPSADFEDVAFGVNVFVAAGNTFALSQ
ncbi:MAG: hypothetical protein WD771_08285 [Gemmatimonadaceae bacterium]